MSSNEYNSYTEPNQDMPYNYFVSVNNNLPTMANNNLIDLSNHAARAYDLTVSESTQTDSSNNVVIRTKGAKKIMIDNKGASYQSGPSKTPTEGVNYEIETRRVQMPFHDIPPVEVSQAECIYDMEVLNRLASFEDISSVETQNDENNSQSDEIDQHYSALDESTMAKIQECSEINKAVINTLMNKLSIGMLPPLEGEPITAKGKCFCDSKGFRSLLSCFMDIIAIAPLFMKKPTSEKSTQTVMEFKEPPVVTNKATQTVVESLPRVKINTKVHPNKDPNKVQQNKEQTKGKAARNYYNAQTSKQYTNVPNNQQEQFYNNQQFYPQIPTGQSHVMQTELNRNNMQLPMMQYGMPYAPNMQGAESGNNGMEAMLAMNQYGMTQTQTTNAMLQRDYRMTGMQMPQPNVPQHDPSVVQAQRADVSRNMMEKLMQSKSYHQFNATLTATVPPTFYQRRNSANVPTQEIPREVQRNQPVTQTLTQATTSSAGRGRRTHPYYETANSPYPLSNQWQMPNYDNQFRNK